MKAFQEETLLTISFVLLTTFICSELLVEAAATSPSLDPWNDVPDIPERIARDLCRTVIQSRMSRNSKFLMAVLKNPVNLLKRSFPITPPRFYPGCYTWRWIKCFGDPYRPLADRCGIFSPIRIENDDCGYVMKTDFPPSEESAGGSSSSRKDKTCPCDWPCTPFFDPIQRCRWNRVRLDSRGRASAGSDKSAWGTHRVYLDHNRASQICLAVERTRMDRSFHVRFIPVPLAMEKEAGASPEACVQWMWQPCGSAEATAAESAASSCGLQSCFPYSEADVESLRRQRIGRHKTCNVWRKIVRPSPECAVFKQPPLPEVPANATELSTERPNNSSIDATDILEINNSTSNVTRVHRSSLIDGRNKNATSIRSNVTTERPMDNIDVSARESESKRNRQRRLCTTPKYKRSKLCRAVASSLGFDLFNARPVINRPAPLRGLIQCNWFAENALCTVIPRTGNGNHHHHRKGPPTREKRSSEKKSSMAGDVKAGPEPLYSASYETETVEIRFGNYTIEEAFTTGLVGPNGIKNNTERSWRKQVGYVTAIPQDRNTSVADLDYSEEASSQTHVELPEKVTPKVQSSYSEAHKGPSGVQLDHPETRKTPPETHKEISVVLPAHSGTTKDAATVQLDYPETLKDPSRVKLVYPQTTGSAVTLDYPVAADASRDDASLTQAQPSGPKPGIPSFYLDLATEESDSSEDSNETTLLKEPRPCGVYSCFPMKKADEGVTTTNLEESHSENAGRVTCHYESGRPVCKFQTFMKT